MAEFIQNVHFILSYLRKLLILLLDVDAAGVTGELFVADAEHRQVLQVHVVQRVQQVRTLRRLHHVTLAIRTRTLRIDHKLYSIFYKLLVKIWVLRFRTE